MSYVLSEFPQTLKWCGHSYYVTCLCSAPPVTASSSTSSPSSSKGTAMWQIVTTSGAETRVTADSCHVEGDVVVLYDGPNIAFVCPSSQLVYAKKLSN